MFALWMPTSCYFYPRPPRGGRPDRVAPRFSAFLFLSTPSARRATRFPGGNREIQPISIHALREEGDPVVRQAGLAPRRFLSTPSARRATTTVAALVAWWKFLSTPSARRATPALLPILSAFRISIHALREEGDRGVTSSPHHVSISIHALREEGDPICAADMITTFYFYPRPPRGGRRRTKARAQCASYFYPRPPRGGRPYSFFTMQRMMKFLSTPSARRATKSLGFPPLRRTISIHALREEGDVGRVNRPSV